MFVVALGGCDCGEQPSASTPEEEALPTDSASLIERGEVSAGLAMLAEETRGGQPLPIDRLRSAIEAAFQVRDPAAQQRARATVQQAAAGLDSPAPAGLVEALAENAARGASEASAGVWVHALGRSEVAEAYAILDAQTFDEQTNLEAFGTLAVDDGIAKVIEHADVEEQYEYPWGRLLDGYRLSGDARLRDHVVQRLATRTEMFVIEAVVDHCDDFRPVLEEAAPTVAEPGCNGIDAALALCGSEEAERRVRAAAETCEQHERLRFRVGNMEAVLAACRDQSMSDGHLRWFGQYTPADANACARAMVESALREEQPLNCDRALAVSMLDELNDATRSAVQRAMEAPRPQDRHSIAPIGLVHGVEEAEAAYQELRSSSGRISDCVRYGLGALVASDEAADVERVRRLLRNRNRALRRSMLAAVEARPNPLMYSVVFEEEVLRTLARSDDFYIPLRSLLRWSAEHGPREELRRRAIAVARLSDIRQRIVGLTWLPRFADDDDVRTIALDAIESEDFHEQVLGAIILWAGESTRSTPSAEASDG